MQFKGTKHDDNFAGTTGDDTFNLAAGGNDTATGDLGNDKFTLGATLNAADRLDGGDDRDTVYLNGDYSGGITFDADTIKNIEALQLHAGFDYDLTLADGNVAAGLNLTVDAHGLAAANHLTFDGTAETDGSYTIRDGAGDDDITGGQQGDLIRLNHGGEETANGGNGNDTFKLGATLDAGDRIAGGAGRDFVYLVGDYSTGLTFGANTITAIEKVTLEGVFDYDLTLADGNVAAGQRLAIDGSRLDAAHHLTFDGSLESDGKFTIYGGAGDDILTSGAQSDLFDITMGGTDAVHGGDGDDTTNAGAAFTAADTIDGGAGNDAVNISPTGGINNIIFTATTLTNVENLTITSNKQIHIFTNDANVASGATLTVDFSASAGILGDYAFDGSAETDGHFAIIGPADAEFVRFTGGALSDTFTLGNDDTPDNQIYGGGGDDTFTFTAFGGVFVYFDGGSGNDTMALIGGGANTLNMTSVETVKLDDSNYSITAIDASVAPGATLTVDASALTASHSLAFNGSSESDGNFVFQFAGGFTASDSLTGGAGNDTLSLNGDYSGSVAFSAATITSIETITVADGHSYQLISDDNNVGSGDTLTVDGSALTGTNALIFNGFAETDGHFAFTGGAGNDDFHGSAQSDTFDFTHGGADTGFGGGGDDTFSFGGTFDASDFVDGGGGSNTLVLNGDYSTLTAITLSNVANIETLQLLGGANSYDLTFTDDITTALTVDASGAASLTFSAAGDTTTAFTITGSAGNDTLVIGDDGSSITGGGGADALTAGSGTDTFVYASAADSAADTKVHADTISGFDASADRFDMPFPVTFLPGVIAVTTADDFNDFGAVANSYFSPGENDAVVFHVTSGALGGHSILLIDFNGDALYSGASDLAIDITGYTGTMTGGDFI